MYTTSYGQENLDNKYLFDGEKIKLNTFYVEIAPSTAWDNLENTFGKSFLIETGIHLNRKFVIGIYSSKSDRSNQIPVPVEGSPEYQEWIDAGVELDQLIPGTQVAYLNFAHSGINLGYMLHSERTVFYRANLKFGAGKLGITQEPKAFYHLFNEPIYSIEFVNVNPEIGIGINLRPWWRVVSDVGYRFILGSTEEVKNPGSLAGLSFKLGFAFGAFDR